MLLHVYSIVPTKQSPCLFDGNGMLSFKVKQKSAINCFEEYLAIEFQRVLSNGTTVTSLSFLNDVQINFNSQSFI